MYTPSTGTIAPRFVSEPETSYKVALAIDPDTSVVKTIAPGQPGTLRWKQRHGESLVCVRYRESADGSKRYTTIELVVEERIARRPEHLQSVAVKIRFDDAATRQKISAAGGVWNAEHKVWILPRTKAKALNLRYRSAAKAIK